MTTTSRAFLVARIAAAVGALAAVVAAVSSVISGDWYAAVWAVIAAVWGCFYAVHRCPVPPPADRGLVLLRFVGGPMDGADVPLPALRELQGADVEAQGTEYRVTGIEHTHYIAEVTR